MKPSVGRSVHYQSYGTPGGEYLPEPRAATITEVKQVQFNPGDEELTEVVGLAVLNPSGLFFDHNVKFAEVPTPGHWNWAPRV
jgi:hypothetical protein